MGFFKKLFSKEADPPPEERRLPSMAKDSRLIWITTQVFVYKKEKNLRVYGAALHDTIASQGTLGRCYYYIDDQQPAELRQSDSHLAIRNAIILIAEQEKAWMESPDMVPVPGLKGNYREIAPQYGLYCADNGDILKINQDTRVATNALFGRKALDALYGEKKKEPPEVVAIATWEDFYREIVNNPAHSSKRHQSNAMALVALLREGESLYSAFLNSFPTSQEALDRLESRVRAITYNARERLGLSAEQTEQLVGLIMQGPDPNAAKPSPAPQKKAPKDCVSGPKF